MAGCFVLCVQSISPVVKLGTWGGDGGVAHDITVAPQRLESITIRWGKVLDSVAFTYRDKDDQLHTAGPWGGAGGEKEDPDKASLSSLQIQPSPILKFP